MPEERKPAPLPPLPWKANPDPWYSRTQVQDAEGCIIAEIIGTDEEAIAVADLLCRAPALEAERDDAYMLATANNEVTNSLHEQLKDAHALQRELVKAARVITDDRYVDEWGKAQIDDDDLVALEDVLRRAEAEAGEETR